MKEPSLLIKTYLSTTVIVKLRDSQIIKGTLHGFDEHLNILLSNVDHFDDKFMFIRGEGIISIGKE